MEVAIGIDELNWYGPTTEPFVIPMRKLFDSHCTEEYCREFKSIDFALRVGESEGGVGRVSLQRRASSIGVDVLLDIAPAQFPDGIQEKIALRLREGAEAIAKRMDSSPISFRTDEFLRDVLEAIEEYESTTIDPYRKGSAQ